MDSHLWQSLRGLVIAQGLLLLFATLPYWCVARRTASTRNLLIAAGLPTIVAATPFLALALLSWRYFFVAPLGLLATTVLTAIIWGIFNRRQRLATAVSVGPFLMLSTWTFLILARFGSGM